MTLQFSNEDASLRRKRPLGEHVGERRRVLNALVIREMMLRYGHDNLGFMWLFVEPMLICVAVMLMWSAMHGSMKQGIPIVPFVLTGYSVLNTWRKTVSGSINAFEKSADLLYHRKLKMLDMMVARSIMETFGPLIAFFMVYIALVLPGFIAPIEDFLLLLTAWYLLAAFGFGVAMIVACITQFTEVARHFVPPIMYVTIPLTGAFFMVAWVPAAAQEVLLYSPLINISEMFRAGFFGSAIPTHYDIPYVLYCILGVNLAGFAMYAKAIRNIEA